MLQEASIKRRQIYMFAFPVAAVFIFSYLFIAWQRLAFYSVVVAACIFFILLVYTCILYIKPQLMMGVEISFYYFIILFLLLFGMFNLINPVTISKATMDYFGTVISGMTMWEVIFIVGAYLAVSQRDFKIIIYLFVILYILLASVNIGLMIKAGRSPVENIFHWIQGLFALGVTLMLILRIGRLQQTYATTDPLTGILNRRAGADIVTAEYQRTVRYNTKFSVILIDLDHFKNINDSYGHSAGDLVLRNFSEIISKMLRKTDFFVRWGGEEFLIILPDTDLQSGGVLAERLCIAVRQNSYEKVSNVTASFGVTAYQAGQSLEQMLNSADSAMYQAKQNGRNQVFVFQDELKSTVHIGLSFVL